MDQILQSLTGAGGGAVATTLVCFGFYKALIKQLTDDVKELKATRVVTRQEFDSEMLDVHQRISRNTKDLEESVKDVQSKLYALSNDMSEIKGYMRRAAEDRKE